MKTNTPELFANYLLYELNFIIKNLVMATIETEIESHVIRMPEEHAMLDARYTKAIALPETSESIKTQSEETSFFLDEYIEEHWHEFIMVGLSGYDDSYYKSDKYKENLGTFLINKYK